MDINNVLYVFNDVPGLNASKGERIVKALEKLKAKIKQLQQIRESERANASNDKDLTIADIKLKLLVLQEQYIRTVLKNKGRNSSRLTFEPGSCITDNASNDNVQPIFNMAANGIDGIQNNSKETQTGHSLCEPYAQSTDSNIQRDYEKSNKMKHASKTDLPCAKDVLKPVPCHKMAMSQEPCQRTLTPSSMKDSLSHYHLKFDDVPFILGASSSASHNVVANVQNIISLMKSHNKVLCGSRSDKNCTTLKSESSSHDTNKMLKELSEDLTELQAKQAKLIEKIDMTHNNNYSANGIGNGTLITRKKHLPKENKPSNFKRENKKEKHAMSADRTQANFLTVSRHRFMRSIHDFKTHLSEEDISWE